MKRFIRVYGSGSGSVRHPDFDNKQNFLDNIRIVETKVARSVGILYKLKYVLPKDAQMQLYHCLERLYFSMSLQCGQCGNTFPTYICIMKVRPLFIKF